MSSVLGYNVLISASKQLLYSCLGEIMQESQAGIPQYQPRERFMDDDIKLKILCFLDIKKRKDLLPLAEELGIEPEELTKRYIFPMFDEHLIEIHAIPAWNAITKTTNGHIYVSRKTV